MDGEHPGRKSLTGSYAKLNSDKFPGLCSKLTIAAMENGQVTDDLCQMLTLHSYMLVYQRVIHQHIQTCSYNENGNAWKLGRTAETQFQTPSNESECRLPPILIVYHHCSISNHKFGAVIECNM